MKKILTLFMLFLFLLNVLGFYGVFLGLKFTNSRQAASAMDDESYSLVNAITFKVPLAVPYFTGTENEYQRVDGEFEHGGEVYRMVKQKLLNDTLYVVCVRDKKGKSLNEAMSDYVKTFSDKPASAKQQTIKALSFSKDYVPVTTSVEYGAAGWLSDIEHLNYQRSLYQQSAQQIFSPPKIASLS